MGGEALLAFSVTENAGAIVELRNETDFVTKNVIFQHLTAAVASTAAKHSAQTSELSEQLLDLERCRESLPQVKDGTSVGAALLEIGSVLGERLVLGQVKHAAAQSSEGVVAGYAHPKF